MARNKNSSKNNPAVVVSTEEQPHTGAALDENTKQETGELNDESTDENTSGESEVENTEEKQETTETEVNLSDAEPTKEDETESVAEEESVEEVEETSRIDQLINILPINAIPTESKLRHQQMEYINIVRNALLGKETDMEFLQAILDASKAHTPLKRTFITRSISNIEKARPGATDALILLPAVIEEIIKNGPDAAREAFSNVSLLDFLNIKK